MNLSREKLTLLIIITILFIFGSGIFIWQGIENNRVISSVAVSQIQEKQDSNKDSSGIENKQNLNTTESIYTQDEGNSNTNNLEEEYNKSETNSIMIHVAGEVVNPGVYQVSTDSRVVHAVELAGGATSLANLDSINLASPIQDGQKIYIPSVLDKINQIKGGNSGSNNVGSTSGNSSGKININTASQGKLEELSGIGPSKADSIIDYRNDNGPFKNVDELLNVSGIGDKTLEKIKDDIVVR